MSLVLILSVVLILTGFVFFLGVVDDSIDKKKLYILIWGIIYMFGGMLLMILHAFQILQ